MIEEKIESLLEAISRKNISESSDMFSKAMSDLVVKSLDEDIYPGIFRSSHKLLEEKMETVFEENDELDSETMAHFEAGDFDEDLEKDILESGFLDEYLQDDGSCEADTVKHNVKDDQSLDQHDVQKGDPIEDENK